MRAPLPSDAVRGLELLEHRPEPDLDGIVELTAAICGTPVALIPPQLKLSPSRGRTSVKEAGKPASAASTRPARSASRRHAHSGHHRWLPVMP